MKAADSPRARVEARGNMVELAIGETAVQMTPREAQRFAFYLARAYTRAGDMRRTRVGHLVLALEDGS